MTNQAPCPWCAMPLSEHAPAWTCGSFPGLEGGEPHQSLACAEIVRLKAKIEKAVICRYCGDYLRCQKCDKDWAS